MPGWYIHLDVARKALAGLASNATAGPIFARNGPNAAEVSAIARANPAYTALGAIGPDLFFLVPDFKPPLGNMLFKLARDVKEDYTWWDDHFLGPYESKMGPLEANHQDELNALSGGLKEAIEGIVGQAFSFLKESILRLILEQYDFFGLLSSGVPAGFDEQTLFWSDILHYRETYRFAAALWQRARDEEEISDPVLRGRFQAYALGWMSHLATDVIGHGFVNQKVGGPYRLHWQRHHLVENHMDAQVYNTNHGTQTIYQQISNAALHLWLAFNPDGSSRVDFFETEPNPFYLKGDHSKDIICRHKVWDVDSGLPDQLAQFIADTLKSVYTPSLTTPDTGMVACCPTIISTLDGRVPLETGGFAEKEDIVGAYWWLHKYVKLTTTDFYKIRRPEPPEWFVIPSFPLPPGSGDSDPGPGAGDDSSFWDDSLELLLALVAWADYLEQIAVWPTAVLAGIVGGTLTIPVRAVLYEYLELPLYNLWLAVHTYRAMTGYVMPMPEEINPGLTTLGKSGADGWAHVVAALGDPNGGLTADILSPDPSGRPNTEYPKDVLIDPPNFISDMFREIFTGSGPPAVNRELPSEFTRPWRWPGTDNEGDVVNVELPQSPGGPFVAGMDGNALFRDMPGSRVARDEFEAAKNEAETIRAATRLLPQGLHLGDPRDYTAYVVATLTRAGLKLDKVVNFNLDADRGYGYLCWDWTRDANSLSMPKKAFKGSSDPSHGGAPTVVSQHVYPTPLQPGYGWDPSDQIHPAGLTGPVSFDPSNPRDRVRIRYIGWEGKFP